VSCKKPYIRNPRQKKQQYCSDTACQKARKITILREYLRQQRGQVHQKKAYIRFESKPGQQTQIDWGHFGVIPYVMSQKSFGHIWKLSHDGEGEIRHCGFYPPPVIKSSSCKAGRLQSCIEPLDELSAFILPVFKQKLENDNYDIWVHGKGWIKNRDDGSPQAAGY